MHSLTGNKLPRPYNNLRAIERVLFSRDLEFNRYDSDIFSINIVKLENELLFGAGKLYIRMSMIFVCRWYVSA